MQDASPLGSYLLLMMKEGGTGVKNTEAGPGVVSYTPLIPALRGRGRQTSMSSRPS